MKCNICGYINTENAPTCPICGNILMQSVQEQSQPQDIAAPQGEPNSAPQSQLNSVPQGQTQQTQPTQSGQPQPVQQPQSGQPNSVPTMQPQSGQLNSVPTMQPQPTQSGQPQQAQGQQNYVSPQSQPMMQSPKPLSQSQDNTSAQLSSQVQAQTQNEKAVPVKASADKKSKIILGSIIGAILIAAIILVVVIVSGKSGSNRSGIGNDGDAGDGYYGLPKDNTTESTTEAAVDPTTENGGGSTADPSGGSAATSVAYIKRPSIIEDNMSLDYSEVQPSVPSQTISDISELNNADLLEFRDQELKDKLLKNQFVVTEDYSAEFFEVYEYNRYDQIANFVTVDSIMHTYHLYFAHVLKNTEINYLSYDLAELGSKMQQKSEEQYATLKGTEWENAARINLAYFTVGNALMNKDVSINPDVQDVVNAELNFINEASQVTSSPLMNGTMEDYSQYKPRGYYDNDERLQKYFKAMMWYGRRNFTQKDEDLDRAALLMTLALDNDTLPLWDKIYTVTSFFAGASDDSGYYEYRPIIDAAYGADVKVSDLPGNVDGWNTFHSLTGSLEPPKINSVVVLQSDSDEEKEEKKLGYRFMGQRFSIDAAIFQNLCFSSTKENAQGGKRMLPNSLDVPAAMGSDTAYTILDSKGETGYKNYPENMEKMRAMVEAAPDSMWQASLYSQWINTLRPLLDEKGEGYPTYMQSEEWRKKNLVSFLGSYAELKHDTILYSKQMMAEMGGEPIPDRDDRGYVEAEPLIYARLTGLVNATSSGLEGYGVLSAEDKENLKLLAEITGQLQVISEKELRNELPTDEEFDFIRTYGGQLEHFWQEANKDMLDQSEYGRLTTKEFPAALVVDVATDPNGSCLELGTGRPNEIIVVITVDGVKKAAFGSVYSYYEFEQPLSDRLTDHEWKQMIGLELKDDNTYTPREEWPKQVDWSESYRYDREY